MSRPVQLRFSAALRAAYHPLTFLGLLILLAGVVSLCAVPPQQRVERATVTLETATVPDEPLTEAQLVLVGAAGESTRSVTLPTSPDAALRLTRLLAALREALREDGQWPPELPAPQVFLIERHGVAVAVLNFSLVQRSTVTIAQEQQLYASLEATLQRHGVGEMRILINGHPSPVFINHLALKRSLD